MAVRFKLSDSFRVEINFYGLDEKGKKENFSFTAVFKRLSVEQAKDLYESAQKPGRTDADLLREVLIGWTLANAETGEAVPFTPETVDEFCKLPSAAGIAMIKFFEVNGLAREKN